MTIIHIKAVETTYFHQRICTLEHQIAKIGQKLPNQRSSNLLMQLKAQMKRANEVR
jgi:hypothetical protein